MRKTILLLFIIFDLDKTAEAKLSPTTLNSTKSDVAVSTALTGTHSTETHISSCHTSDTFNDVTTKTNRNTSPFAETHITTIFPSTKTSKKANKATKSTDSVRINLGERRTPSITLSTTLIKASKHKASKSAPSRAKDSIEPKRDVLSETRKSKKHEGSTVIDPTDSSTPETTTAKITTSPFTTKTTTAKITTSPSTSKTTIPKITTTPSTTKTTTAKITSSPSTSKTTIPKITTTPSTTKTITAKVSSSPSSPKTTTAKITTRPSIPKTTITKSTSSPSTTITTTKKSTTSHSTTITTAKITTSPSTTKTITAKVTTSPSTTETTIPKITTSPSTTSTTKATTVKSTTRTTTSELCQNGGTYDGTKCLCNEDFFIGPKCEFLSDEIPVSELSVTVTVEAQVKVTNKEYNKSLEDLNSSYSREIQAEFKLQMKSVYRAVPGYRDVEILRMRKGSVIVEHKVIFHVQIKNDEETILQQMENITKEVNKSLADIHTDPECIKDSGSKLCFVPLPDPILNSSFSLNDTCKNISGIKYADYYYPHKTNGTVHCVSRCFSGIQDSMNCFNGVCRLSEIGPHCICNNQDMFWYLDSYCQMPVQKTALGFGLALAVLFVVSTILVIFLIRAKQKNSKNSWSTDADTWYEEDADEEWVPSGGLNIMNKTAVSSLDEHQDRKKTFHFTAEMNEFYRGTYPASSS